MMPDRQKAAEPAPQKPTLAELFIAFLKIGLTSFGGGISGWMRLEFVQRRRWITEKNFLLGLSLSQALPGVNVVNLALWIGFELHGSIGAAIAVASVVMPPMLIVIILAEAVSQFSGYRVTHLLLAGIAVAGFALGLGLGIVAAHRRVRDLTSICVFIAAFSSIFIFHLSTMLVLAVLTPISVGLAYWKVKRDA